MFDLLTEIPFKGNQGVEMDPSFRHNTSISRYKSPWIDDSSPRRAALSPLMFK